MAEKKDLMAFIRTDNWFKSIDSVTTHFYWKNKKAKIKLSTLQKTNPKTDWLHQTFSFTTSQIKHNILQNGSTKPTTIPHGQN